MTLEEAKRIVPTIDDTPLSDRIHAAGGPTGSSKTPGAPWSTHGMRYASRQWPRGKLQSHGRLSRHSVQYLEVGEYLPVEGNIESA